MDESNINYQARLPLQWQLIDTPPDNDTLSHTRENNLEILKQALLLDEFSLTGMDEHVGDHRDTARIEKKLDLLLSLLGSMVQNQQDIQQYRVQLTSDSVQWEAAAAQELQQGQLVSLQLYLHPYSVSALSLYGEVSDVEQGLCRLNLCHVDSAVQELMQKFIFLNHRRQVAASRKNNKPS